EYARGLINYASSDTRRILRQPTHKIADILGSIHNEELIHRDNLVVLIL
ncbi:MAG: glutamate 5-kinase, partial [Pelistega sp.]|nr:glutamate 5-kinase [Pelistega sp.]